MKKSSLSKVGPLVIGTYLLSFFLLFLFSLLFPSPKILSFFYIDNALKNGLRLFFKYLIPIHAVAILIAYSLFIGVEETYSNRGSPIHEIISPIVIFIIILTALFTIVNVWINPMIVESIRNNEEKSHISRNYYKNAKTEIDSAEGMVSQGREKNYRNAFILIQSALKLNPEYSDALKLEKEIRRKIIEEGISLVDPSKTHKIGQKAKNDEVFIEGLNADGLMKKANSLYDKEDYFSAYYYAQMAFKLDNQRLDARNLSLKAMNKIKAYELSIEDEEIKYLYIKKQNGYNKLINGAYIDAYYIFKELLNEYPDDPDIKDYLNKVIEEFIKKLTFFYDEVANLDLLPSVQNILFINEKDELKTEFVFIEKMVTVREGIFFKNIEVLKLLYNGQILSHIKAPYGKYIYVDTSNLKENNKKGGQHHINFNCIYKNKADFENNPGEATDLSPVNLVKDKIKTDDLTNILRLRPDIQFLDNLSIDNNAIDSIGLLELISTSLNPGFKKAGHLEKLINIEIIIRILNPFLFLFISFISITIGWVCRSRYTNRPPILLLFFIPIFPIIIFFLIELFILAQRTIFSFTILSLGFIPTLSIFIVVQSSLIILSLILIAGKLHTK